MIVGDITRFTNKGMGLAMRVLAAGLAALLALTFLNLTVLPGTALAEEADGVDAATEHLVLPAPEEPVGRLWIRRRRPGWRLTGRAGSR